MQRLGFTACALLVSALVLVPPTMAKDTHSPTAGPDQLIELSGKPAHAEQRVERLAQTRDHRKRSPGAAVVAPPAAVIIDGGKGLDTMVVKPPAAVVVKPPAAIVVKPPATRSPITVLGNQLKAKPGYILEKGPNNTVVARQIGGAPGTSVTLQCLCGSTGFCKEDHAKDVAVCYKDALGPCQTKCAWKGANDASNTSGGLKVQ